MRDQDFRELIDILPNPMAVSVSEYLRTEQPSEKLHRLFSAAETVTKILAIVMLMEVKKQLGDFPRSMKYLLVDKLERPSFGVWREIGESSLKILRDRKLQCTFDELDHFWKEWSKSLKGIIYSRNKVSHPGLKKLDETELLRVHRGDFEELLLRLKFMSRYEIFTIAQLGSQRFKFVLRGLLNNNKVELSTGSISGHSEHLKPMHVYLSGHKPDHVDTLDLFPLIGCTWNQNCQTLEDLSCIDTLVYHRGNPLEFSTVSGSKSDAQQMEEFKDRFKEVFRLKDWKEAQEREKLAVDFKDQIDELSKCLIGRDEQVEDIKKWIKEHSDQGGILWIGGKPGVGKSALMAKVALVLNENSNLRVLPYFFRAGDAHCNPSDFYRTAGSLLERELDLIVASEHNFSNENNFHLLMDELERRRKARSDNPSIVYILDGLDEVADLHPDFVKLPLSTQSPGVLWICTGRLVEKTKALYESADVYKLWSSGELSRLRTSEIRDLIETEGEEALRHELQLLGTNYANNFIKVLSERSEGIPLYIKLAIQDLKEGRLRLDRPNDLPPSLEAYFERFLSSENVSDISRLLTAIMCILSLVHEQLDQETIVSLLTIMQPQAKKILPAKINDLLESHEHIMLRRASTPEDHPGWMLYHDAFREHLQNSESVGTTRNEAIATLLKWCRAWKKNNNPYALRWFAIHLKEQGKSEALFSLTKDKDFLVYQRVYNPELPLSTIRLCLEDTTKPESFDPVRAAELVVRHIRMFNEITSSESPLEALKRGATPQLAWRLADMHQYEYRVLWYLLIAWNLKTCGDLDNARLSMEKLAEKDLVILKGLNWEVARFILLRLIEVNERYYEVIAKAIIDNYQGDLCDYYLHLGNIDSAYRIACEIPHYGNRSEQLYKVVNAYLEQTNPILPDENVLDQAKEVAHEIKDDFWRAEAYSEIACVQYDSDIKGALKMLKSAQELASTGDEGEWGDVSHWVDEDYDSRKSYATNHIFECYVRLNQFDEAKNIAKLLSQKEDYINSVLAYQKIASAYINNMMFGEAHRVLDIMMGLWNSNLDDKRILEHVSITLVFMGFKLHQIGRVEEAESTITDAENLAIKSGSLYTQLRLLSVVASVWACLGCSAKATAAVTKMNLLDDEIKLENRLEVKSWRQVKAKTIITALVEVASFLHASGSITDAKKALKLAKSAARKLKYPTYKFEAYLAIAEFEATFVGLSAASRIFDKAYKEAVSCENPYQILDLFSKQTKLGFVPDAQDLIGSLLMDSIRKEKGTYGSYVSEIGDKESFTSIDAHVRNPQKDRLRELETGWSIRDTALDNLARRNLLGFLEAIWSIKHYDGFDYFLYEIALSNQEIMLFSKSDLAQAKQLAHKCDEIKPNAYAGSVHLYDQVGIYVEGSERTKNILQKVIALAWVAFFQAQNAFSNEADKSFDEARVLVHEINVPHYRAKCHAMLALFEANSNLKEAAYFDLKTSVDLINESSPDESSFSNDQLYCYTILLLVVKSLDDQSFLSEICSIAIRELENENYSCPLWQVGIVLQTLVRLGRIGEAHSLLAKVPFETSYSVMNEPGMFESTDAYSSFALELTKLGKLDDAKNILRQIPFDWERSGAYADVAFYLLSASRSSDNQTDLKSAISIYSDSRLSRNNHVFDVAYTLVRLGLKDEFFAFLLLKIAYLTDAPRIGALLARMYPNKAERIREAVVGVLQDYNEVRN